MKRTGGSVGSALAAMRSLLGATIVLAICLPAAHAQVTLGGTGGSNLVPFGTIGGANTYTGPYQQVYTSTAFPETVSITSIAFQSSPQSSTGAYSFDGTLGLAVSSVITPASPGTTYISTTPVFSGTESATIAANGTFDLVFNLPSPFIYDPTLGNLVLGVDTTSATSTGDVEFVFGSTPDVGRTINTAPIEEFPESGLLTQFGVGPVVPEPSTLSLLGALGIPGAAFALRRRRA